MSTLASQLLSYRAKVYIASGILVDDPNEVDSVAAVVSDNVDQVIEVGLTYTLYDYTTAYVIRLHLYGY